MQSKRKKAFRFSSFFIIVSLVIFTIVLLASLKKRVFITGEIEVSALSMELQEQVPNFLSITTSDTPIKSFRICSYQEITIPLDTINVHILPVGNEKTSNVVVSGASLGNVDLERGNHLKISMLGRGKKMRLSEENFNSDLRFSAMNDTVCFDLKESYVKENANLESVSLTYIRKHFSGATIAKPMDNGIELVIQSDSSLAFEEPNTMLIKKLNFDNSDKSIRGSTILNGSIHVEGMNTTIQLSKNKKVIFPESEEFEITHFLIKDGSIKINFEGYTKGMSIGHYGNEYVPSMLEYLYKNNYLLVLFNSFMTMITFLLFIMRESKTKE